MTLFRRKKTNRRRPAPGRTKAKALLRRVPRARLPRGRSAAAAAAVLILCGLAAWQGARAYARGSLLTVARLEVSGNRHWPAARLLEIAGLEIGQRAHEVPFRAARKNLSRLPGVESASVRYLPGGRLRVRVREADVVAVRRAASGWAGLTPAGEWMPLAAEIPEDVPVLEGGGLSRSTERRTAAWLAGIRAQSPEVFAGFSQVLPRGEDGEADVYWRDGRVRLRVDCAGAGGGSLEYLAELLRREQDNWTAGATVDLRVEGYAYVR